METRALDTGLAGVPRPLRSWLIGQGSPQGESHGRAQLQEPTGVCSERGSSAAAWMAGSRRWWWTLCKVQRILLRRPCILPPSKHHPTPYSWRTAACHQGEPGPAGSWFQRQASRYRRGAVYADSCSESICPLVPSSFQGHHHLQQKRSPKTHYIDFM